MSGVPFPDKALNVFSFIYTFFYKLVRSTLHKAGHLQQGCRQAALYRFTVCFDIGRFTVVSRYKVYVRFRFASQKIKSKELTLAWDQKSGLEATTEIKIGPVNKRDL